MTIFLGKGCAGEQDLQSAKIQYTANTRGFYERIVIQDRKMTVMRDRNDKTGTTTAVSDADWKKLVSEFSKITLTELPNLKAPTEKRFYDGAPIGDLIVTYQGQEYQSSAFDHGTPPAAIAALVNHITALAKQP